MPYTGIDSQEDIDKMDKCVEKVMGEGKDKSTAIAICRTSIMGKKETPINDRIQTISSQLQNIFEIVDSADTGIPSIYIRSIYETYAIIDFLTDKSPKSYKIDYTADDSGNITSVGNPIEVEITWTEKKESAFGAITKAIMNFINPDKGCKKPNNKKDDEEAFSDNGDMLIWKDKKNKTYRWLAIFTNKYRDVDNPSEILSSDAHKDYVKSVDAGEYPMPQLWHWHIPNTQWGTGDWVAYDEVNGFTLASGTVDKGHEDEAIAMIKTKIPIKVSHGMPLEHILRDEKDKSVITRYRTFEISDLPANAAANQLTSFAITKESKETFMAIPDEKKVYLEEVGLTADKIAGVEAVIEEQAKTAKELNIESKEVTEPVIEAPTLTRDEVADAFLKLTTVIEQNTQTMVDQMAAFGSQLSELKERVDSMEKPMSDKVAAKAMQTPTAALADLVALSVLGKKDAQVDRRENLAKQHPIETKEAVPHRTGVPFLDMMLGQPQV